MLQTGFYNRNQIKKEVKNDLLSLMDLPDRLEPNDFPRDKKPESDIKITPIRV